MAAQRNGKDELAGIGVLIALILVGAAITALLEALRELALAIGKLFVLYIGAWAGALVLLPIIDLMIVAWRALRRKRRMKTSIAFSSFPNHELLQDSCYLDHLFWGMIEDFIGRRIATLKKQKASPSKRPTLDRRIDDQQLLMNHLLRNKEAFRRWKHDHMYAVLADRLNRRNLIQVYGLIWRFCREDYARWRQSGEVSPFTALILNKIDLEPTPDQWFMTKGGVFLLSFGRLHVKEGQQSGLVRADSEQERLRRAFSDESKFRRFLDLHLFEIMHQIGPFSFDYIHGRSSPPSGPRFPRA